MKLSTTAFVLLHFLLAISGRGLAQDENDVVTEKERTTVQHGVPIWLSHIPRSELLLLIGHQVQQTVTLILRPGFYGQTVNMEEVKTVDGIATGQGKKNTKNTYAFTFPNLALPDMLYAVREVPAGSCCFSGVREIQVPICLQERLTVSFVEVLKAPVEVCQQKKRGKHNDNLQTFIQRLNDFPVVNKVVHYDFKNRHKPGVRATRNYPLMKQTVLSNSIGEIHPRRDIAPITYPDQSVHLFHILQQHLPLQLVDGEVLKITSVDDGKTAKDIKHDKRKATTEEVRQVTEMAEGEQTASLEALKSGATASCAQATSSPCYQDDLLDTDCSTIIFKVSVTRPSGAVATGIVIIPIHEDDDVLFFFAGSDEDAPPPPDDNMPPVAVMDPERVTPGPASPVPHPSLQHSFLSLMTIGLLFEDDAEAEANGLRRSEGYRGSYRLARPLNYFARSPSISRSIRFNAGAGNSGGGRFGGVIGFTQ